VAKWANAITAVAAAVALFGLIVLYSTLLETQHGSAIATDALVANNRSWLSPERAEIITPFDISSKFGFDIIYNNTGREPALAFTANEEVGEVLKPKPTESWFTVFHKDTLKDMCSQTIPATEITVYPTPENHVYEVRTDKLISQDVVDGKNVQWVHGCFGYFSPVSGKAIHRSEYCFLFIPGIANGRPIHQSVSCMYGNKAN
jgi:hypothetical protein